VATLKRAKRFVTFWHSFKTWAEVAANSSLLQNRRHARGRVQIPTTPPQQFRPHLAWLLAFSEESGAVKVADSVRA